MIEHHFGLLLMGALSIGLLVPGLESLPAWVVPYIMGAIIYLASSKISPEDIKDVHYAEIAKIYLWRFLLLPVVIYFVFDAFLPSFKLAALMLALLPSGATLPSVTAILKGNPVSALGMLILTCFLAPFVLPFVFSHLSGAEVEIDALGMLKTLSAIIFLPIGLYVLTARFVPKIVPALQRNSSAGSMMLISCVGIIIVSSQRHLILSDGWYLVEALSVGMGLYCLFYFLGWLAYPKEGYHQRVTYALMSGNNNIAIGISLAFLYLPERETIALVVWELAWLGALSLFQYAVSKTAKV